MDKKRRNLFILAVIVIGIFVTVIASKTFLQTNSKASLEPAVLLFSPDTLSVKNGEPLIVKILLNPKGRNIMGADVTVDYNTDTLSLDSLTTNKDFSNEVIHTIDDEKGEARFTLAETGDASHTGELLELATLSFLTKQNGTATLSMPHAQVVALGINTEIPLAVLPGGTYTITSSGDASPTIADATKGAHADLIPLSLQLTDAQGNVKTSFKPGEQIYTLVTLSNKGTDQTFSDSGYVYSYIYSDSPAPVATGTVSSINMFLRNGLFGPSYTKTYGSFTTDENNAQYRGDKSFTNSTLGAHTARIFMNYDHKAREENYDNNQLTTTYTIAN